MNCFKDKLIEQLFADERFSPIRQKIRLMETAEQLADIISAEQKYPFEFICFKITGYRPETQHDPHLIAGDILIHDLAHFIMAMSKTIAQPVQMLTQPVFTVQQASEKINVSTKTIDRWRHRGLICRSIIFEDGKRRVGILESSLNSFLQKNNIIVEDKPRFSRLKIDEISQITELALVLAQANPKWSRQKLIKEVAIKAGRAPETIRYTLINNFSGGGLRFEISPATISPEQTSQIYAAYLQGMSMKELMSRYSRSKSTIYRIINQHKSKHFSAVNIEYIDSEDFHNPESATAILKDSAIPEISVSSIDIENLPGNISRLKDIPILTRDQELSLFRLYNCLKYEAKRINLLSKTPADTGGIRKVETYLKRAEKIKNILVCANLRLVVSIARKHTNRGAAFADLVSEGSMALMRAVEGYNYKKGFRFATYASWAITRSFAEVVPDAAIEQGQDISQIHSDMRHKNIIAAVEIEEAGHNLTHIIAQNLDQREQYIIRNHYGLDGSLIRRNFKSMKEIGEDLGISGERVRQLELQALQKLRHCLSTEMFDALLK